MTPATLTPAAWMLDLRGRALEWVRRQPLTGETEAYARLMFAFGLARTGAGAEARSELDEAGGLLQRADDAHQALEAAFRFRVGEALAGRPPAGPLSEEVLARIAALDRFVSYAVDRLRKGSRILEPDGPINPYRHWGDRINSFEGALSRLYRETHPTEFRKQVKSLLGMGEAAEGGALRVWNAVLRFPSMADKELAAEAVEQVLAMRKGPSGVKEGGEALDEIATLERSLHFVIARGLAGPMPRLLKAAREWCTDRKHVNMATADLVSAAIEGLWVFRMGEEADCFLNEVATAIRNGPVEPTVPQLTAALALADGWFRFGWDRLTVPVFAAVEGILFSGDLPPRDLGQLAQASALAVRSAPHATADAWFRQLFDRLPPIRDTYTTSSHYGFSVLEVAEAVCLSAVEVCGRI
jgi:hypothetical protein